MIATSSPRPFATSSSKNVGCPTSNLWPASRSSARLMRQASPYERRPRGSSYTIVSSRGQRARSARSLSTCSWSSTIAKRASAWSMMDSSEKEMEYIIDHAEARFAIVEDQEQVDKLLALRARCPRLETIVYDDPRGLRSYGEACLMSLAELREAGHKFEVGHPTFFDDEVAKGRGEDVAIMCYASGTTGVPKGAMLSHRNLIVSARSPSA